MNGLRLEIDVRQRGSDALAGEVERLRDILETRKRLDEDRSEALYARVAGQGAGRPPQGREAFVSVPDLRILEDLAGRIFAGFLRPAAEIDAALWRERYKVINRGAGVVAGAVWVLYAQSTEAGRPDVDHDRERCILAEHVVNEASKLLVDVAPLTGIDPKTVRTLSYGLRKRVAKCLLALEGVNAPEVVS